MESGGYFLIAVIVLLVIGVISGNAKRKKDGGEEKKEENQWSFAFPMRIDIGNRQGLNLVCFLCFFIALLLRQGVCAQENGWSEEFLATRVHRFMEL